MSVRDQAIDLLGVQIDTRSRGELLELLEQWAFGGEGRRMYYVNGHVLNLAVADPQLRASLNGADIVIPEGYGAVAVARAAGLPAPEQHATMDWIDDWLTRLAARGARVYLVGDEEGVAAAAGARMQAEHPGLEIVGAEHGFFGAEQSPAVVDRVRAAAPNVLMVGMGTPRQELWIDESLASMGPVGVVLALGAMFRWYSGRERRAGPVLRAMHLEWLGRLARHPRRHFDRYVRGNPALLAHALRQRRRGTRDA